MTRLTLLLVATAPALLSACRPEPAPERLNLLLITLDTTRRDAVAPYNPNANTPNLAALAEHAVVFDDAYSAANVTNPSHTSILTGLPAIEHGLFDNYGRLDPSLDTLPKVLQRSGYSTAFIPAIPHLWWAFEGRGFDSTAITTDRRPARDVVDLALEWLDQRPPGRPFFVWTHFFDAHTPYLPDPDVTRTLEVPDSLPDLPRLADHPYYTGGNKRLGLWLGDWTNPEYPRGLYAQALTGIDHHLGRLFDRLEDSGLLDSTIIVVTADHGESHTEHGILFAHDGLFQPTIRVPLLVAGPGLPAGHRPTAVTHLDLAPSLAPLLGVSFGHALPGRDLGLHAARPDEPRTLVIESARNLQVAAIEGRFKLIAPVDATRAVRPVAELFDLVEDPDETNPLEPSHGAHRALATSTRPWRELGWVRSESALDEASRKQLEALGYVR
jgi:arylsulfatase A-like enzyme